MNKELNDFIKEAQETENMDKVAEFLFTFIKTTKFKIKKLDLERKGEKK